MRVARYPARGNERPIPAVQNRHSSYATGRPISALESDPIPVCVEVWVRWHTGIKAHALALWKVEPLQQNETFYPPQTKLFGPYPCSTRVAPQGLGYTQGHDGLGGSLL
jgi:hypothetical protein